MKVKKIDLIYICIMFVVSMPTFLYTNFRAFGWIMALVQYSLFLVFLYNLIKKGIKAYSLMCYLIILTYILITISSFQNDLSNYQGYIVSSIKHIGEWAFIDYSYRKKGYRFLKDYSLVLIFLIFVNFITILAFPEGMYVSGSYSSNYFLGYDNTHINVQLAALFYLALLTSSDKKYRKKFVFCSVITILSLMLIKSATSIMGLSVFFIGISIIFLKKRINRFERFLFIKPIVQFITFFWISFLLVSGTLLLNFKEVIVGVFGKDITLSSRTLIWTNSIRYIFENPVWGYGNEDFQTINSQLVGIIDQTGWGGSTHNFYLWILFLGGIVLMVVAFLMFFVLDKQADNRKEMKYDLIIRTTLLSVMVMGLVESHFDGLFFSIMLISYNTYLRETHK